MNLFAFINRQKRWSSSVFGDTARTEGILRHIEKELDEIRETTDDIEEWCDVIILALDGAWRAGHLPHEICTALERKQQRNMNRIWPAGTPDDLPCEHDRKRNKNERI